jgi:hypothetical protein
MVYSHQLEGVTFVRYRRGLAAAPHDAGWDNPIRMLPQTFVWAIGGTDDGDAADCAWWVASRACPAVPVHSAHAPAKCMHVVSSRRPPRATVSNLRTICCVQCACTCPRAGVRVCVRARVWVGWVGGWVRTCA